ncbi:hypothetical protein KP77_35290 [Jeotgalibacillus alimentarius]|uniref:YxlC family protein n=1 Tax=Jeotgalibacillus alimentarius TaxID=135826 RepID=A0A0C2RMA3_9BACL|nr:DUF5345 family protein [Jeotgalibacillus alimentarius]KIL42899.1 hypothetical protein KP77_35290 [Jeotgalibacillus alimentarius]
MKDKTEEKLIRGLEEFDRLDRTPPRESFTLMIQEIRQRQRKELILFFIAALFIVTLTVMVLINEPILYVAGQLLFLIVAGAVLTIRKKRVKQHE